MQLRERMVKAYIELIAEHSAARKRGDDDQEERLLCDLDELVDDMTEEEVTEARNRIKAGLSTPDSSKGSQAAAFLLRRPDYVAPRLEEAKSRDHS